jgi:hypothetical protein
MIFEVRRIDVSKKNLARGGGHLVADGAKVFGSCG